MDEVFFNGIWRMDWGLGNPNKTAALIACLMTGLWALAYIRKWGFWAALIGFTALGICLVHTFSRGGLVALFLGLIPVLWMITKPWPLKRIAGILASICIIIGFSVYLRAHERFGQGVVQEDRSVSNRLELWRHAPAMMVDAPGGWGIGNSGKAFTQWYQPLDRTEGYRTMVNSHLTWLVEFGWGGRFFYIAGILSVFVLCIPEARAKWLAVSFGIWIAFMTSAVFSSVAEEPWLWVTPGVALTAAVSWRISAGIWPEPGYWLFPPLVAASILGSVGLFCGGTEVDRWKSATIVGEGLPSVWVVADEKVLGANYGKTLRRYRSAFNSFCVGFASDSRDLPSVPSRLVILSGQFTEKLTEIDLRILDWTDVVLLVNPSISPIDLKGIDHKRIIVAIGEFNYPLNSDLWMAEGQTRRIVGVGKFVPEWPDRLLTLIDDAYPKP